MKWRVLCGLALVGLLVMLMAAPMALAQDKVDLGIITVKQKDLAEDIRAQLVKGGSFESLAKANSVGPASFRGGRLGKVPYTRLRTEYRAALKNLAPNKPSQVIPTEEGYTILMRFDQPGEMAGEGPGDAQAKPAAKADAFRFVTKSPSMDAAPRMDTPPSVAPAPRAGQEPAPAVAGPIDPEAQDAAYLVARRRVLAGVESLIAGQLKAAEESFSRALGDNPREDSAQFLLEMTREAKAGKVKVEAVKMFAQGFQDVTEGDSAAALKHFLKCNEVAPEFWQGDLFAANMLAGQGKLAQAQQIIEKQVLTRNPKSARAYVTLGMMAADEKRPNQARQYLEKAIQLNPEFAQAHYQLGLVALYSQDLAMAERQFKRTVTLDPYNALGFNNLGLVYVFKQRFDEAEEMYKKSLALDPSNPNVHLNLGNLYASRGKLDAAIDEYVKCLTLSPSFAPAFGNMAGAYALKKDWPEAIKAADRALELGYRVPPSLLKVLEPHREAKKK